MALFPEEKKLMEKLVDEWYIEIHKVTKDADGIFSAKGKLYDVNDPVWTRAEWPYGFVHEINKKANRVKQLMSGITEVSGLNIKRIEEANEELDDTLNYCRMMRALNNMLIKRWAFSRDAQQILDEAFPEGPGMVTAAGKFIDNWPEQSRLDPGETRHVGGVTTALYIHDGESVEDYQKRVNEMHAGDGNIKEPL